MQPAVAALLKAPRVTRTATTTPVATVATLSVKTKVLTAAVNALATVTMPLRYVTRTAVVIVQAAATKFVSTTRTTSVAPIASATKQVDHTASATVTPVGTATPAQTRTKVLTATVGAAASMQRRIDVTRLATVHPVASRNVLVSIARAAAVIVQAFLALFPFTSRPPIVCIHWTLERRSMTIAASRRSMSIVAHRPIMNFACQTRSMTITFVGSAPC